MAIMTLNLSSAASFPQNYWMFTIAILVVSVFISILYSELAVRLGVGRRWMAVCCVMLSIMAGLLELAAGSHTVTPMLPVQCAVPLTVGWWCARRRQSPIRAATKFFVFALSPIASYSLLWLLVALAVSTVQPWLNSPVQILAERFGSAGVLAWSFGFMAATFLVPAVIASLLYCKLAGRFGIGDRWMTVSCVVLAVFTVAQASCTFAQSYQAQLPCLWLGMMAFVMLAQSLIPLSIGWWFTRRRRNAVRLRLAPQ
jgi:hypothetical protein